jgi:putative transposase
MCSKRQPAALVSLKPIVAGGHTPGTTALLMDYGRVSGAGRPPKLSDEQFTELCGILEEGQPWTPQAIHTLIEDRYGVTYDPAHLSRKLRNSGMHYAKPRPMDPRSPDDAEEILVERLVQALDEDDHESEEEPVILGFFR